jgi:hypothetical protein
MSLSASALLHLCPSTCVVVAVFLVDRISWSLEVKLICALLLLRLVSPEFRCRVWQLSGLIYSFVGAGCGLVSCGLFPLLRVWSGSRSSSTGEGESWTGDSAAFPSGPASGRGGGRSPRGRGVAAVLGPGQGCAEDYPVAPGAVERRHRCSKPGRRQRARSCIGCIPPAGWVWITLALRFSLSVLGQPVQQVA